MADVHAARRRLLLDHTAALDVEGLLVTHLVNVRYLTGFTGSNGALLLTPGRALLGTDGRYRTQAGEEAPDVDLLIDRALLPALARCATEARCRRLGFEDHQVTIADHDVLVAEAEGVELVRMGRPVEQLRAVKDEEEISLIAAACAIADRAFAELLESGIRPGLTERDVAYALEDGMRRGGADGPSFETIVATGSNSAVPHHRPTDRELQLGDLVKCDFGALVGGYHSDMTRTFVLGPPADWQQEIYAVVTAAQQAGRDAVAPGADCREVDQAARAVVDATEYAGRFVHGLGHGVGLEIHEAPGLSATTTDTLRERMPVTIEPGVYLPGQGGVRIEDTLVVRSGGPDLLTMTTRDLLVL